MVFIFDIVPPLTEVLSTNLVGVDARRLHLKCGGWRPIARLCTSTAAVQWYLIAIILLSFTQACFAVAPANDVCTGATTIPGTGPFPFYTSTVDVKDATTQGDPPLPGCLSVSVGRSVWFKFTPSATRLHTISASKDTATTALDTVMAIYTSSGGCNGPFVEFQCNDDQGDTRSAISATLNANVTYYVVVWMSSISPPVSGMTSLQLRVSQPVAPVNDTCAGAELIPGNGPFPLLTSIADTTLAGTGGDPPAPSCWADHARSVWFKFTPAAAATYEFSLCTNTATTVHETVLAIYASANGCSGPFTAVACNHTNTCGNKPRSTISIGLAKEVTYYIVAWEGVNAAYTPGETLLQLRVGAFLPPATVTLSASSLTSSSATLNGTVDANGLPGTAWFQWGPNSNYVYATSPVNFPATGGVLMLSTSIAGLQPGQITHFRLVANNSAGTTWGDDRSFAWSAIAPRINSFAPGDGTYVLQFVGQAGQVYLIESSSNLLQWATLGTASDLGNGSFTLSAPANLPSCFYRARSP